MTPVEERIDHIQRLLTSIAEPDTPDERDEAWNEVTDLLTEHSAREELIEQAICLADNAEAYLDLEAQGVKNYPDSLRLCIDGLRAVLPKESPCQ